MTSPEPLILYLADADSGDPDEPIRRATVLRRVELANGERGWLVDIEPPFPAYGGADAVGRAVLANHYVGTSLDDLVNRGVGLTPRYRIAPVYVCAAVPPATLDQDSFATGDLSIAYWGDVALRPGDFPGAGHEPLPAQERLRAGLLRLEDTLRFARAPIADYLAPGLGPEIVRQRLAPVGIEPCDELLMWYGWHDGTTGNVGLGHETWDLAPGVHLLSLEDALKYYGRAREFAESMVEKGIAAGELWPEGAFPIMAHLMGDCVDAVSCDPATAGATWFVPWDDAPEPNGPHLADLVERLHFPWWHGAHRWDGERWVMGPEALLGIGPDVPW
jgi:hypothetical protein